MNGKKNDASDGSILDAMVHAYVDGELDGADRDDIETAIAKSPELARKVAAYRAQKQDLHLRYDAVLNEELSPTMTAMLGLRETAAGGTAHNDVKRWAPAPTLRRLAAAVALIAIGAGGGWLGRGAAAPSSLVSPSNTPTGIGAAYAERAMGAHNVYAVDVRHPVEVGANEEDHLIAWLSKRLGRAVRAPDMAGDGFHLIGGRLLADDGRPAALFMYQDGAGRRVTLSVKTVADKGETSFRFVNEENTSAVYWIEGGLGYALAGNLPRQQLLRLARQAYNALIA
ncbi:anti-sigma factor family protein [Varunaivibrio sulfuroxidans]|uniref:Anti-sigma factor RsiW n=1 Tax=Varunaivibrio sulfuroxidans TaxID=1773489 RepID=A0A4R3JES0_9PROT|nr:anti-sigma factor [Varunaivibrio sulfuroxidans]TCS63616.1 anti-sigma factor RsiW [Varunaivibrio sulfuroxidans]WES30242.1 anti-sigma factor [Varunaivibrio sulfuroxidans]